MEMTKTNQNFLTTLYFKRFELSKREEQLMKNNTFSADENGVNARIRNDQSISEVRGFGKELDDLITRFLQVAA